MSASDILRKFIKRDVISYESRRALDEFFRSPCYNYFLKYLRGPDILGYADFLDEALNLIPTTEKLWTSCLSALRQICGDRTILPTTHVLSKGLIKRRKAFMNIHDIDTCWEAQYKRTAVRVRSIQMSPASERALLKKFCHEVVLLKRLDHPNLASVLGVTMDPYQVVFDRVSDKDITRHTMDGGVSLISDIAEGLGYLHSHNIVHGRLRTGVIFINDDCRAMLTDYGSTSVVWNPENISQQIIRWCAPEVHGGDKVSGMRPTYASDVFSFAMVVLEIFSGKAPFDGVSDDEVVERIRSGGRPDRPTGPANLGLSDTLWGLVQQCWDDSAELRPRMADVINHIRKIRSTLGTECSEAPTLVNPNVVPKVNRWKRFSNLMPAMIRLVRRKSGGGAPIPGGG